MFNYIFNAIKVKMTVAKSLRILASKGRAIKLTTADDVKGTPGSKLPDMEGYVIDAGKYSMGLVLDTDKVSELVFIAMLTTYGLSVRKVVFSFYKGVGDCYDGEPDGWVCTNI